MEISELEAMMKAGTVHNFNAIRGGLPEGVRGTVVKVGVPGHPDVAWVRDLRGNVHNWDRRTMFI
jgi:hypothetical protein